jgi:hypothetical protein
MFDPRSWQCISYRCAISATVDFSDCLLDLPHDGTIVIIRMDCLTSTTNNTGTAAIGAERIATSRRRDLSSQGWRSRYASAVESCTLECRLCHSDVFINTSI